MLGWWRKCRSRKTVSRIVVDHVDVMLGLARLGLENGLWRFDSLDLLSGVERLRLARLPRVVEVIRSLTMAAVARYLIDERSIEQARGFFRFDASIEVFCYTLFLRFFSLVRDQTFNRVGSAKGSKFIVHKG